MRRVTFFSLNRGSVRHLSFTVSAGVEEGKATEAVKKTAFVGNMTLPAVDLAYRIVCPSLKFPATSTGKKVTGYRDPCVFWREYYSFDRSMPYYHHLPTNVITFEVPNGFLTRFPLFYRRRGFFVNSENRVFSKSTTENRGSSGENSSGGAEGNNSSMPPSGDGKPSSSSGTSLTLKQKLAAYGGGGLLLYLIVHNVLLACIFFSLYFLHIDLVGIARSYGFSIRSDKVTSDTLDDANITSTEKKYPSFWATLGISIVLNKLLVPIELAVTLMMAPVLVPRLQPFASRVIPRIKSMINSRKAE
ncbi:uncharacterized protein TM35_000032890 [Trypanosoma theileri]|uniref:Uncharacterized protein n=1 Tax=Trypanosoma theileri TaxID=67003 RepID=A0A1X0P6G8_9TRYP|nr:uncharacterized protein TM35_000032890 [Trypanosoma theileri]ORC92536.1 hypothetical protein TM35_000032890 [Trypanosoma theileri]